jgi:hypothetical protein
MPSILTCPSCGMKMQIVEEHLGRKVQCPGCASTFTAAAEVIARTAPPPVPPRPYPDDRPPLRRPEPRERLGDRDDDDGRYRRRSERGVREAVGAPAVALMVVAIIGLVVAPLSFVFFALGGSGAFSEGRVRGRDEAMTDAVVGTLGMIGSAGALAVSILILIGALKMQKLQSYGMAVTASILAMVPLLTPCCLLGLPFGIWSLTVLNREDVKRAFR